MNINISEIVFNKLREMEESKIVLKTIENTIENSVTKAIQDSLNSYKLKNSIEEKVTEQVSAIVNEIGFTAYNGFIAEKIKQITESVCTADISSKIQKSFDEIFLLKRESIKLSEICEAYRDYICEALEESEKYDLEHFYASIEEHEEYKWIDVKFAKEKPAKYNRDESISFTVHRSHKDKNIGSLGSLHVDGYDISKSINFGHMSSIEALLINLKYNNTPITIDVESEDDIDYSFNIDN